MASFVSALDKPGAAHGAAPTNARLRECLRFLRHVDRVDFHAEMARNWDARKCFVVQVVVKDDEVGQGATDQASLLVVRPTAPFQIERTPKELEQLQKAMHQWSARHGTQECAFCSPISSGDIAIAARRASGSADDESTRGMLSSLFHRRATKLKGSEEWEAWLNASIVQVRQVDVDAEPMCEGLEHIPALLARFLLQEFASDVIL